MYVTESAVTVEVTETVAGEIVGSFFNLFAKFMYDSPMLMGSAKEHSLLSLLWYRFVHFQVMPLLSAVPQPFKQNIRTVKKFKKIDTSQILDTDSH